jgi:D-lyxose ketol-isomerase
MTPGWHVTRDLNLLSLTMGMCDDSNVSSNKCVCKKIMVLKPNQLQVATYHPQANAMNERVQNCILSSICSDNLTSKNNHENLEEQENHPFDYFLQSTAWLQCY